MCFSADSLGSSIESSIPCIIEILPRGDSDSLLLILYVGQWFKHMPHIAQFSGSTFFYVI